MKTTKRNAGKPALKAPPTIAELAKGLAISCRRVSQLKLAGLPTDTLDAALKWRSAQSDDHSVSQLRKERVGLVKAQREKQELENARLRGEMISRAGLAEEQIRIGHAMKAMLRRLENELPQLCLGLPLERSRPATKNFIRSLQAELADSRNAEFWPEHVSLEPE